MYFFLFVSFCLFWSILKSMLYAFCFQMDSVDTILFAPNLLTLCSKMKSLIVHLNWIAPKCHNTDKPQPLLRLPCPKSAVLLFNYVLAHWDSLFYIYNLFVWIQLHRNATTLINLNPCSGYSAPSPSQQCWSRKYNKSLPSRIEAEHVFALPSQFGL